MRELDRTLGLRDRRARLAPRAKEYFPEPAGPGYNYEDYEAWAAEWGSKRVSGQMELVGCCRGVC